MSINGIKKEDELAIKLQKCERCKETIPENQKKQGFDGHSWTTIICSKPECGSSFVMVHRIP